MTSIATEIKTIVNNPSMSNAKKREALLKLGIRTNEIALVLPSLPRQTRRAVREVFKFKFGIELETLCRSFGEAETALQNEGVGVYNAGRYYHSNNNTRFELKTDSSIHGEGRGVEVVSSVLDSRNGLDVVKKACKALNDCGASVNRSTGYHVHISTEGMTDEWFSNVFVNYARAERVIDSFMAPSRRGRANTYCDTLRNHIAELDRAHSVMDVRSELGYNRYHKVNAEAYGSHGTIEFRQHHGTVNATKVCNWVSFCAALVAWSKDNRLDHDITSVDEMAWLTDSLKTYYKGRMNEMAQAA